MSELHKPTPWPSTTALQVMVEGVCYPDRFVELVRDFIVSDDDGSGALIKKMVGRVGVEPTTPGLKVRCSAELS